LGCPAGRIAGYRISRDQSVDIVISMTTCRPAPRPRSPLKFRGPQRSSKHPGSRILDCLVVVECEQALDVSHQRPNSPPNQYGDPDHRDERDYSRPHHNIQQSNPERPDLELVMATEE